MCTLPVHKGSVYTDHWSSPRAMLWSAVLSWAGSSTHTALTLLSRCSSVSQTGRACGVASRHRARADSGSEGQGGAWESASLTSCWSMNPTRRSKGAASTDCFISCLISFCPFPWKKAPLWLTAQMAHEWSLPLSPFTWWKYQKNISLNPLNGSVQWGILGQ